MSGVGLMMIVKNEEHVLEACLASVKPLLDWWVVADTGSSDGTRELVRRVLGDLPGRLVERPWVDFGHNRQEVLDLAREVGAPEDHVLWIDADEHLVDLPDRAELHRWLREGREAGRDGYHLTTVYAGTRYGRLAVVRLASGWRWEGPVHEYLALPDAQVGVLEQPVVVVEHTGARSRDPETYRKDAALLAAALAERPDDPRLQFYRAQSLRDAGDLAGALAAYRTRIANPGGWEQERVHALLQVALLLERTGEPAGAVLDALLEAYAACPWRAEALVEAARIERLRGRFAPARLYAEEATRTPMPGTEALFVDADAHTWRSWDELAVACYWTGRFAQGAEAARRALAVRPDDDRLRANLDWCLRGLAERD